MRKVGLKNRIRVGERGGFPRPDLIRNPSYVLDGQWMLCPDRGGKGMRRGWYRSEFCHELTEGRWDTLPGAVQPVEVTVPFPLESEVNQRSLAPRGLTPEVIGKTGRFWYFTRFKRPPECGAGILHFGAVDYRASVWLNGEFIGNHEGGYTPFRFLVGRFDEENVLAVLVEDSRSAGQVRGKQTFLSRPFMVWYTGCTGIWQPVWIEPVGRVFIESLRMKRSGRSVVLSVDVRGHETGMYNVSVSCSVYAPQVHGAGRDIAKNPARVLTEHTALDAMKKGRVEFTIPEKTFTRWDVGWPAMHPVEVTLHHEKKVFDTVHALYGLRDLSIEGGAIRLNGKPLYQRLLLNQGYYPAGLYTPEGPEMFKTDIELMKRAGFNGCRMHQKIEHPAFLYWADLLGFLVWEEMPSYYMPSAFNMKRLEDQLHETMRRDAFHPSIITLVLFNESWGIYNILLSRKARRAVEALFDRCKDLYPDYLVVDNSGFHHLKTDIADVHHYLGRLEEVDRFYRALSQGAREAPLWYNFLRLLAGKENVQTPFLRGHGEAGSPLLISEFGGYGFDLYGHENMPLEEFLKRHIALIAKYPRIQGFCYTQFTDVFQEGNGLYTVERVPKVKNLREIMEKPFITRRYDKNLAH